MRILFDRNAIELLVPMQHRVAPDGRAPYPCYAAGAPYQTTLELWNGKPLASLANVVVEAQCTYTFGEPGYVLPGNEGRLHRYIEMFQPVDARADITLLQLILTGPRAETDAAAIRTSVRVPDLARWTAQRQMGGRV